MTKKYNREAAKNYAKTWAYSRNPKYYAFDKIGGDCTNFISQCIYAGSNIMNYTPTFGWYYIDSNDKSPSWTGVEYLYNFLINNTKNGPFGSEIDSSKIEIGDVIQLGNLERFFHSLLVVGKNKNNIYVAAHDFNAYMKPLNSYIYQRIRFIHIEGVRN